MTQGEFIQKVAPMAVVMANRYNVPASLLIAQTYLESNFGNSQLGYRYNNLTGMKATGKNIPGVWEGEKINLPTTEHINGTDITVPQYFRVYNSWKESIEDLANRYAKRFHLTLDKVDGNVDTFLADCGEAMKTGYATDPNYEKKIRGVINNFRLGQFDKVALVSPGSNTSTTNGAKKKVGFNETEKKYWSEAA